MTCCWTLRPVGVEFGADLDADLRLLLGDSVLVRLCRWFASRDDWHLTSISYALAALKSHLGMRLFSSAPRLQVLPRLPSKAQPAPCSDCLLGQVVS